MLASKYKFRYNINVVTFRSWQKLLYFLSSNGRLGTESGFLLLDVTTTRPPFLVLRGEQFMDKLLKFGLYVRKSTDTEDKQVQSLEDQTRLMSELARQKNLMMVEKFVESKSAKLPGNRPEFERMMSLIENGSINAILCWQFNRLSRNPTDSGRLQQLLQDGKLQMIQTSDKAYTPSDNALLLSVEAGMSNQYIRELAANTKRGMKSKALKGDKPGIPPIGYLNDRLAKTIVPDPELFPKIRTLWDKMLTGTYSVAQLVDVAEKELLILTPRRGKTGGKALAYSTLHTVFKNIFYTGKLSFLGNVYKGNQVPMVTEEEFKRVQEIIDPGHTTRPKNKSQTFLLRNLLKCGECGYGVTAELKTKKLKSNGELREYIYYHCTGKSTRQKCAQRSYCVTEQELVNQIKLKLEKFTIDPDFYRLAIEALAEEEDFIVAKEKSKLLEVERAIHKKTLSISSLRRMRYSGEADDDAWYFAELAQLESTLKKLQDQRSKSEYEARNWRETADEVFTFARYAKEDFDSDDHEKKRSVIFKLGERLSLMDRTITFTPNNLFVPIEKMNDHKVSVSEMVRTAPQQMEDGSNNEFQRFWLRRLDSNQRPKR